MSEASYRVVRSASVVPKSLSRPLLILSVPWFFFLGPRVEHGNELICRFNRKHEDSKAVAVWNSLYGDLLQRLMLLQPIKRISRTAFTKCLPYVQNLEIYSIVLHRKPLSNRGLRRKEFVASAILYVPSVFIITFEGDSLWQWPTQIVSLAANFETGYEVSRFLRCAHEFELGRQADYVDMAIPYLLENRGRSSSS